MAYSFQKFEYPLYLFYCMPLYHSQTRRHVISIKYILLIDSAVVGTQKYLAHTEAT